jgi:hypothetical protein
MEMHLFNEKYYFWLDYAYVIRELPIMGIQSKDVLARRMRHIEECGIFEFMCFEGAGNKTYFRFVEKALFSLLSDTNKQEELFDRFKGGSYPKVGRVPTQKSEGFLPKSRDHVYSSINDSSINDSKKQPEPENTGKDIEALKDISKKMAIKFNINIAKCVMTLKNKKKFVEVPPYKVVLQTCEDMLKSKKIDEPWPWFNRVLLANLGKYNADKNIKENEQAKNSMPNKNLAEISAGIGNRRQ